MSISIKQIGENAGVVWRELYRQVNPQTFECLKEATGLNMVQLSTALGWLARENKISIYENGDEAMFSLSPINFYI